MLLHMHGAKIYWEIFEVQNFQGWIPFANKFSRIAPSGIIDNNET